MADEPNTDPNATAAPDPVTAPTEPPPVVPEPPPAVVAEPPPSVVAEPPAPVAAEPEPPAEGPADPLTQAMVDFNANGHYVMVTLAIGEPKNRQLVIGGTNVEHVGEDAHGRWKFRRM